MSCTKMMNLYLTSLLFLLDVTLCQESCRPMEVKYTIAGFIDKNVSVMFHLNETCGQDVVFRNTSMTFCRIKPSDKSIVGNYCTRFKNGSTLFLTKFNKLGEHVIQLLLENDSNVINPANVTFSISEPSKKQDKNIGIPSAPNLQDTTTSISDSKEPSSLVHIIETTSDSASTERPNNEYTITVVLTVSLVVVVIVITISLWCCWRRKRQKISRTPGCEDKDSANKDQRDNLINKSKESEDLSSLPPSPSGAFTDWQTSKGQLTFLDEDQKQAPPTEVLSTPREKRDFQQTPQHSIQSVMELLKNLPQSPELSDGPLKSINKQITKLTYRSGADGSVEIKFKTNICPDKDQEKEDVSLGQHKMQQESPNNEDKEQAGLAACKTCIVDMELKSSIDVQEEQTATDVHRGFVDPDIKVIQHEDSMNLKQSGELEEPATQEDRLVKPSSPPEVVSPDSDLSANTNNFSENPEETSKLLGKWSTVDQDSQSQTFETQADPEILLSHVTTTTKLSEDNTEQQESSPVSESASETGLLKVRTVQ
ncbi:uncharacterized protein LOC112568933 [Pomacea canaliculata]|uniref:uncharacterized protein LOC112568933 n=1 Tax=Pomacea canaliculata TaxID=400727 RepID=UPI000D7389E4|nr:uncharacterized protein LOC112568933 [Pomacea canaliculata]